MLGMFLLDISKFFLVEARFCKKTSQIMKSVSSIPKIRCYCKIHQAPLHQIAQRLSRWARSHLENSSRSIAIEIFWKNR